MALRVEESRFNCVKMTQIIRSLSKEQLRKASGFTKESLVEEFTTDWVRWVLWQDIKYTWNGWEHCLREFEDHLLHGKRGQSKKLTEEDE